MLSLALPVALPGLNRLLLGTCGDLQYVVSQRVARYGKWGHQVQLLHPSASTGPWAIY